MDEEEKLVKAVEDTLVTLEVIDRIGHLAQNGECRGNWLDVNDVYGKLKWALEAYKAQKI